MRISDWSSDVCSSDLPRRGTPRDASLLPRSRARSPSPSVFDAHADILHFEEVLDAVLGSLPSEARFLHAAEGRNFGGDDAGVEADDAVLQPLRPAPRAAEVAGVEVCGEAELVVVCNLDLFVPGIRSSCMRLG